MFTTIKGIKINPVDYVRDYISTHDNIQIFVGCDSQNTKETTTYVTAIVLYSPGNGGHIIYEKERTPKEKVRSVRLMNEVWKSVSIANDLVAAGIQKPDYIDIDVNPNAKYNSMQLLELLKPMDISADIRHLDRLLLGVQIFWYVPDNKINN